MELLQGEAFDELFRSFQHTAFHLELQDSYNTPEETGPFELFLAGEPDDFGWHQPWLTLVREATDAGKKISRARVVSVPHGLYTQWGLAVAPLNIRAGEDIRWLPRHTATELINLPTDDYWLFDDRLVVFTIFEPNGRFAGGASTVDSAIVDRCRRVHEYVWTIAIEHDVYASASE